ncbi:multicopper oxidase family protein [Streptomyces typhae]|uniref:multicopper oxidase family protein n=1 Tax=Streptomyces typhae TaxID=2681492 RepID=UPI001FE79902|nr:multicopper oxidase domain-containing protein [Streptomyces typhae]
MPIPPVLRPHRGTVTTKEGATTGAGELTVHLRETWVQLHSQLPPTRAWGYEGHVPGPTIEVRRGRPLTVVWRNHIAKGDYPVLAYEVPMEQPPASNRPGRTEAGAEEVKGVSALPPWSVTHLHGAVTGADNDGWPENGTSRNEAQYASYPNDQRACGLWYHDHAMHITRFNVQSGLAGMYLVRDVEEDALALPSGAYEVPLMIADRNLDTDGEGRLSGRLLHKTEIIQRDEHGKNVTLPFSGPYTLVNGAVWPHLEVAARWYRFRVLNASNARVYRLALIDEATGETVTGAVKQIGTDAGLLPRPVAVDGPLALAPAERVDLLIDFSRFRGRRLRLVNTTDKVAPGKPDPGSGLPFPHVLQFRVRPQREYDPFLLPAVLSPSFRRITHENIPHHGHRLVVLTPPGTKGGGGHPEIWEMRETKRVGEARDGIIEIANASGRIRAYERIARTFDDTPGFTVESDAWEQWEFLNLAPNVINLPMAAATPMHPMHIHLTSFQVISRDAFDIRGFDPSLGGTVTPVAPLRKLPVGVHEEGWKDTVQAYGEQRVSVVGQFTGGSGRFVYHCHVLEHEDAHMMRPFIVQPREVTALSPHAGHGGHDNSVANPDPK